MSNILRIFGEATGLRANLQKYAVVPIGCAEDQTELAKRTLGCQAEEFPIKYLGLPLAPYKLTKADLQPLVDKVMAKLPSWKG
ncbi:hypothetical protein E2562_024476 [Oryza meyeriana var. granulata]|uniref:Uncharacterized protein n=1 Tax=Oryza meyeriana var. granulata TaxID=110450 RepID=A0A6G1FBG6_9ORYZ|nr:hypothetical protein E2562_024476 [Oryza meyeriana var. granulata]